MPELPEVEVLRASLEATLPGRRIVGVRVDRTDLRAPVEPTDLVDLVGRAVVALRRRAKYLLIDLDGDRTLMVHLGMSGQLTIVPADEPRVRHEHVAFHLGDGRRLRFVDPRRFGLVVVVESSRLGEDPRVRGLGIEPLGRSFDGVSMAAAARGRRAPVKSFLMDGRVVVGVGNIYASEALHRAGVHPARKAGRISLARWERLVDVVRAILLEAIRAGGSSVSDYVDGAGRRGDFQRTLSVYGRDGQPCLRCGRSIRRLVQSGRSTYYCPGCQR